MAPGGDTRQESDASCQDAIDPVVNLKILAHQARVGFIYQSRALKGVPERSRFR